MNLHGIAQGCTKVVNPPVDGTYQQSTGYTTNADGERVPTYATAQKVTVQLQPMTFKDLMQVSSLNLNGEKRAIYITGDWDGVSRADQHGGDLITVTNDGSIWLVVQVLENWYNQNEWVKVAAVRQNG